MLGFSALSETTISQASTIKVANAATGSVVATGAVNLTAAGVGLHQISGVAGTGVAAAPSGNGPATTSITGVTATATFGSTLASIGENLVSVSATSAVGTLSLSGKANSTLTSISASGATNSTDLFDAKANQTLTGFSLTTTLAALAQVTAGASITLSTAEAVGIAEKDTTATGTLFDYEPFADDYSRVRTFVVTAPTSTDNTAYITV